MLSSSPGPAEVWWPSRDEILIVRPCTSLNEALANAGDGLVLIMEASALAKAGFISDVQAAAKMLVENGDIAGVVLIGKEFTSSQKLREHLSIQVKTRGAASSPVAEYAQGKCVAARFGPGRRDARPT